MITVIRILDGKNVPTAEELNAFAQSASNVYVQCDKKLKTFERIFETLSNPFLDTNNFGDPELDSELDLLRCKLANALLKSIHKDKGQ